VDTFQELLSIKERGSPKKTITLEKDLSKFVLFSLKSFWLGVVRSVSISKRDLAIFVEIAYLRYPKDNLRI